MIVFKDTIVFTFICCFFTYTLAYEVNARINLTFAEFEQKCEKKGLNYNDTLSESSSALRNHMLDIYSDVVPKMDKNFDGDLSEIVNTKCMNENSETLIRKLLDNVLLCYEDQDYPSENVIREIVKTGSHTFCLSRVTQGIFTRIHRDCIRNLVLSPEISECQENTQNILRYPLFELLYPLPVVYTSEQCALILKNAECFQNATRKHCDFSTSSQYNIIINEFKVASGCSL